MTRLVFPDGDPELAVLLRGRFADRLEAIGGLELHTDGAQPADVLTSRLKGADAILLGNYLPTEVMADAPDLRLVSFVGAGVASYLDLAAAARHQIAVTNTPHYGDGAVAEHTLALLLAVARDVPAADRAVKEGGWFTSGGPRPGTELSGKTIGLLGFGGIAQHLARLAVALGMRVVVWTRDPSRYPQAPVRFGSLVEALDCDVVSLHLMLNEQTRGIVDAQKMALVRPGAILLNTARAELIAPGVLETRLAAGDLRAGLDVFEAEPLPAEAILRTSPNVVLTPHQGYNTPESLVRILDIAITNVERFLVGDPVNMVSP